MPAPTPTALIDAVDGDDRVIGQIRRREALDGPAGFRTVHVFATRGDRILLQRLATSRRRHAGQWGSSVAGYLHAGETYEEGAARRQAEELGLRGPLTEIGVLPFQEDRATKFVGLFEARVASERPVIEAPEQIAAIDWWTRSDVALALEADPGLFTPTFARLYEHFVVDDRR